MTRISIALATYNGARFLQAQLDSYAAQERLPDELVVGDDGSTDETLAILTAFAAQAPFPVRILDGPAGGGITANFERTIRACSSDLILLSDQDDIWLPGKIAAVERALAAAPRALALHHDEWLIDADSGARLPLSFNQRARRSGAWEHVLYVGNCTALRRALLPIVLPIPDGFGYDGWLSQVPEALGARLILDEPLQLWRRHGDNSSQPALAESTPPSRWAMARRFGDADPRAGWQREAERLALVRQRIEEQQAAIDDLLGAKAAERAAQRLSEQISGLNRRADLLAQPRHRRWIGALRALGNGDYRRFSGWRSALKDAIRG